MREYLVTGEDLVKNPVSLIVGEYRRVRRHQISLSAIELLTDPHHTKYSLTVDRQLCLN
ncbi:hypothetical protein [Microcoleus sp. B3-D7]|uniref:hypothetical protein n=1 Tax=Microcoleus sp. B3-D7 TaxID=2818659 RepID=UPI002FD0CE7C